MLDLDAIKYREQRADKGPWFAHNPDDSSFMNIYCVTTSDVEPKDEFDLENSVCVTLLQSGLGIIGNKERSWEENAEFIAHAREDVPALIAEVERQADLLKRAMAIITEAIMHGMPVTEEVAAVRNAIVCKEVSE